MPATSSSKFAKEGCTLRSFEMVQLQRRNLVSEDARYLYERFRFRSVSRLLTSTSHNSLAVRGGGQVEDPGRVASQSRQLSHRGVLPDDNLVLAVAVGADNFIDILAPSKVAHLASCRRREDFGKRALKNSIRKKPCGDASQGLVLFLL